MGITLRWGNQDQSVIWYHIEAPWTWEDADHARIELERMIQSVHHRVDFIFDVGTLGVLPKNTLQVVADRFTLIPANVGIFTVVGAPTMVKVMIDVLRLMRPEVFSRYHVVDTFEEAYRLIYRNIQRV